MDFDEMNIMSITQTYDYKATKTLDWCSIFKITNTDFRLKLFIIGLITLSIVEEKYASNSKYSIGQKNSDILKILNFTFKSSMIVLICFITGRTMWWYEEGFILKWITLAFIQCIYNIPKLGDFRYLSFPKPLLPCQLGTHTKIAVSIHDII